MKPPPRVYTTPELAGMIKWPRRKLLRYLLKMHHERGETLLVNVGSKKRPRWTTTLEAFHSVAPQWFNDKDTIESRLEELEEARAESEANEAVTRTHVAQLAGEVRRLKTTVDVVTSSLKAIVSQTQG